MELPIRFVRRRRPVIGTRQRLERTALRPLPPRTGRLGLQPTGVGEELADRPVGVPDITQHGRGRCVERSRPSSTSWRISTAVKVLVIEPILYCVSVTGPGTSPTPSDHTSSPSRTTPATTEGTSPSSNTRLVQVQERIGPTAPWKDYFATKAELFTPGRARKAVVTGSIINGAAGLPPRRASGDHPLKDTRGAADWTVTSTATRGLGNRFSSQAPDGVNLNAQTACLRFNVGTRFFAKPSEIRLNGNIQTVGIRGVEQRQAVVLQRQAPSPALPQHAVPEPPRHRHPVRHLYRHLPRHYVPVHCGGRLRAPSRPRAAPASCRNCVERGPQRRGAGPSPASPQHSPNRRGAHPDAELAQLPADPHAAPARVLPCHPQHQRDDLGVEWWPARSARLPVGPLASA